VIELIGVLSGLTAGALHVFTGADHLAAIAPLAAHRPAHGTWMGFKWGLGHGLGASLIGVLGLLGRERIDVDQWSRLAESLVGYMLVGIGVWAFIRARAMVVHSHVHVHDGREHHHVHVHSELDAQSAHVGTAHADHSHATLYVGMLHGSAGAGHAFAVIPALALPWGEAILYLTSYFLAAVGAMSLFGATLGWIGRGRRPELVRGMVYVSSFAAVFVGVLWLGTT